MKPVKQGIDISFAKGLDTKTDPKRVQIGNFRRLENSVFDKGDLLKKRNGFGALPALPTDTNTYLTTFHDNLTAIGSSINAFTPGNATWTNKGSIQPLSLNTLPLVRNNLNQTAADVAISPNGLICTVFLQTTGSVTSNYFMVSNAVTGQNIISPTLIPVGSGAVSGGMRVFLVGNNFVVVFTNTISATAHLQYITVNAQNPLLVGANTDLVAAYIPFSTLSFDGTVSNNTLYIAYNTTAGSQRIGILTLNSSLIVSSPTVFVGYKGTMLSVTADITNASSPTIYISFYNAANSTGYIASVDKNLNIIMNPVQIIASGTVLNITSAAQSGTCSVFYEVSNAYSFDSTIPTNYINVVNVTFRMAFRSIFSNGVGTITASSAIGLSNGQYVVDNTTSANIAIGTTYTISGTTLTLSHNTGGASASSPGDLLASATVTAAATVIRSVGLASKAFIVGGVIYFLSAFQSPYQPSYFLINGSLSVQASPVITAKLAYQNGGGYLTTGLPNVVVNGDLVQFPYLYKDLIAAVNKNTNVTSGTQTAGIYSQTGINLASLTATTETLDTAEIGGDLHLSGGFLWMYDGQAPVEHNFFLWPDTDQTTPSDTAAWTATSTVTPTGTFSNAGTSIVLSSASGVSVGMTVADTTNPTYLTTGTTITAISGTTITISLPATHAGAGDTLSIQGNIAAKPDAATNTNAYYYQFTYEWTDNQGNAFRSAPSIPIPVTTSGAGSAGIITLNIPTLRLTYKVLAPVKVVIYRWSVAQQIYYQVTSIISPLLNSTTSDSVTFVDTQTDANILGNNILYTTGGVVEDVNAPASDIMTLFDTRLWIVDAEDRNLLWYSKQVIEATPVEMSDLFTMYIAPTTGAQGSTGPMTALSVMDDKIIIFKSNAIYYINGTGPDNTGANSQYSPPVFVTSTVGCDNQQSIVFTPMGLMFQSDKGIWLLDRGLTTSYIGAGVEDFNAQTVLSAQNIPATNQVRFVLSGGTILMYDYYYQQWGTFIGVTAISSTIYNGRHTLLGLAGQAYQETPGLYLDNTSPVLIGFKTGPIRLGDLQGYQRVFFYYLLGEYISPHKLLVSTYYDYADSPLDSRLISPTNYSPAFGTPGPFGQGNPYGGPLSLEDWRVFTQKQRCMAIEISVQEIYDPSFGVAAGAGFTLSGINVVCGFKSPFRTQSAAHSIG